MANPSEKRSLVVELRTPEGSAFSGNAAKVPRIPTRKCPMGVLPRHAPLMSSLEMGLTRVVDQAGTTWSFVTGEGFVEVLDDHVLLLVDTAEDVSKIDIERAEAAAERARKRLQLDGPEVNQARARAALNRAVTRIRLSGQR